MSGGNGDRPSDLERVIIDWGFGIALALITWKLGWWL